MLWKKLKDWSKDLYLLILFKKNKWLDLTKINKKLKNKKLMANPPNMFWLNYFIYRVVTGGGIWQAGN